MNPEEIKAQLLNVISNLIKDDPDAAQTNIHDILQAKMVNRVNPPIEGAESADVNTDPEPDLEDPTLNTAE